MNKKLVAAGLGCGLVAALAVAGIAVAATDAPSGTPGSSQAEPRESSTPRPTITPRPSSADAENDAEIDKVADDRLPASGDVSGGAQEAPPAEAPAAPAPAAPAPAAPAPAAPAPPPPAPAPPAASTGAQQAVLNLVNERRAAAGVAPVAINGSLSQAAAVQAQYQAASLTMTHDGNGGLGTRVSSAGYGYCWVGENVAAGQPDANAVHTAWVNSPGHLANILSSNATDMGLASAVGSNGVIYWAQVFGARC